MNKRKKSPAARFYILDGHQPREVGNVVEWGDWMGNTDCHVALTTIGPLDISTIFMGLDLSIDEGEPIVFETLITGFDEDERYYARYASWAEAERMHARACDIAETMLRDGDMTLAGFLSRL